MMTEGMGEAEEPILTRIFRVEAERIEAPKDIPETLIEELLRKQSGYEK